MRKTSIDCYKDIEASGVLSKIRLKVFKGLSEVAPCTSGELEEYMNRKYGMRGTWKVLSQLRERNLVKEMGTSICKINGRKKILWDLTREKYVKPPRRKPFKGKKITKESIDYVLKTMREKGSFIITQEELIKLKREL